MSTGTNLFIRGTLILSGAVLISKVLGLVYVVPLKYIIGMEGINLLSMGYIPYTVLLQLATLGIPLAVSKYVAKYNGLGDYRRGKNLLRLSARKLLVSGTVAAFAIYFFAPFIVELLGEPEALWPIRAVCSALILVPAMAVLRGYFQGWQSMAPTGVSQVIEQLVRVLFILILAYILVKKGVDLPITVALASLGAFFGALAGSAVLLVYWYKRREGIHQRVLASPYSNPETTDSFKELLRYSIPISLVSLAIPLFQLIEWLMYKPLLRYFGYQPELVNLSFAILTQTAHKLMMIPVSLATAFSLAVMPMVTELYARQEQEPLKRKVEQCLSILLYLMIPASLGMYILATPLYYSVYQDFDGVTMLSWYAPAALGISLYIVTASILQGLQLMRWSIICLALTIIVKALGTFLLSFIWPELGAILATVLGFALGGLANLLLIARKIDWPLSLFVKNMVKLSIVALLMGLVVSAALYLLEGVVLGSAFLNQMFRLALGSLVGGIVYLGLTWKMGFLNKLKKQEVVQ